MVHISKPAQYAYYVHYAYYAQKAGSTRMETQNTVRLEYGAFSNANGEYLTACSLAYILVYPKMTFFK
jgi:hypothetical protein